ncbi:MAG: SH3 domain-containing protein, partial [Sulfolobaceae archaeon]
MLAHYDLLDSIIKEKLKTDLTKPNVRVEVDKYVYDPSLTTEMQFVQLEVKEPTITTPSPSGEKLLNPSSVGTMIPPIKGLKVENLKRYISSPYGDRIHPLTGKKDTHKGIDLAFPQGTKVVAAADGRILRIYNQGINTIEILHANGVLTRYLHVAFPAKKAGEKVRQGEIIAEIGPKDAYSTGPHLHFEVLINYDTKNPKDAQHVDPMEYLLGKKFIVPNTQKKEEIKSDLYGTVTAKSGLNIRSGPSTGYKVIGAIPYNGRCKILEMYKDSEWYKVEYAGIQGYSYKYYIQLDSAGGTTSTTTTRPGGNPSYIEIYNYIKEVCNQIGLPPQIGWAIAWKESMWTQFKDDGTPLFNDNGTSADWGIMQINDVAHPDAFPQAKTDWRFNVQYGLKYAYSKYVKAKTMYLDATSIARATYSAYNTGSNYTRWESGTDERDNRFYEIYLTSPWNKNLSAGGEGLIGFINSSIVNLRSSPEYKPDNIVATLKKGFLVSIVGYQNNWYQVVLQDGQSGYIESKYIKRVEDDLLYEFDVNKIFTSNFSQYQQGQVPPASIYSQNKNQWKVGSDNKESVL